jgi:hypothetical protein
MKYNINLSVEVDPDANFLGSDGEDLQSLLDVIKGLVFDIDDLELIEIEVVRDYS